MKKVIRDFECAMCGRCCANQDLVQLTAFELYKLAAFLKMDTPAFFGQYCLLTSTNLNPVPHLYIKTKDGVCPFLTDNKCSVHEARPYACKAYPMRTYWSPAGDVKKSIGPRYPMLEETCTLFTLEDGDVLLGDYELLSKQAIAYWVDDAYFSMETGQADLSIPQKVADLYVHDKEMRAVAKRYIVNPEHPPSALDAEAAYAKISLTLQAARWDTAAAFVNIAEQKVRDDENIGKYLLLITDAEAVKALRLLVDSGRLDLAKTLAIGSKSYPGRYIIAAGHGSSSDHIAIGFLLEMEKETLDVLTDSGKKPLYVFFTDGNEDGGKLVGFPLNVKI